VSTLHRLARFDALPRETGWPKLDAALEAWAKLNILDAGAFTYFRESLKSRAGLLAGVWDQRFTAALYASILDAMSQGLGLEAWLPTAQKLIVEYGGAATLFPTGKFSSSYAELVFRMANASAMAAGRYAQMFAPGRVISDPFVLYSTMQDDRVRDEHAALDGMVFRKDDPDARALFPPSDYNCFPADTMVRGEFDGALSARYSGDLIKLKTAGGNRLTVTRNHPVATERGLVPAHLLHVGDRLVCHAGRVEDRLDTVGASEAVRGVFRANEPAIAPPHQHVQDVPAKIEETTQTLRLMGDLLHVPARRNDLYGDGRYLDGEIEVVTLDGKLPLDRQASRSQRFRDFLLSAMDLRGVLESGLRSQRDLFERALATAGGVMRGNGLVLAGVDAHAGPFQEFSLTAPASLHSRTQKTPRHWAASDPEGIREGLLRFSGQVTLDEISVVDHEAVSAFPVFDLQSAHGWILAGNVYTSNCRCWLIELDEIDVKDGGYPIARGGDFPRPPEGFNQDRVLELAPGVLRRAA
jgi:SPP1 gp7 family putative phage head morphogenesis protein